MNEIYVYIHVPFCVKRCFYCDFVSSTRLDLIGDYLKALEYDIGMSGYLEGRTVRTVYFGGGTPSVVPVEFLSRVLRKLEKHGDFDPIELTLELNPESVDSKKVRAYKVLGFNRMSLGVQAFDDEVLRASGRSHDTEDVERALDLLTAHFENINLDFIVGLPRSTLKTVEKNLDLIIRYKPKHVSVYRLELDESTPLWKMARGGEVSLPDVSRVDEMLDLMMVSLREMGYRRYEISNFSVEGFESSHNLAYWRNLDYAGYGVSAGGHIGRFRYVRTVNLIEYIENPLLNSYERENDDLQEFKETVFMGLRLADGLDLKELKEKFGKILDAFLSHIETDDMFEVSEERLKLKDLDMSKTALEKVVNWDGIPGGTSRRRGTRAR